MTNIRTILAELSPDGLKRLEKEIYKDLSRVRERRAWLARRERERKAMLKRMKGAPALDPAMREKLARAERNIRMVRLAMRGWPDQRIADHVGLTRQWVNQVIRDQLGNELRRR